jgi:hypothetical protein
VNVFVGVKVCDFVLDGVLVKLGVLDAVKLADFVLVTVPVSVPVAVREIVLVAFALLEGVCERVIVWEGVFVVDCVIVGVSDNMEEDVGEEVAVDVCVEVLVSVPV